MSKVNGKEIAEIFFDLKVHMNFWSKLHLEQVFSINGKGDEGKLTMQQFQLLLCIKDLGLNTISELSSSFYLSKSSTSLSIAKMVEKGYLEKESPSKEDDGRKIYLHLTKKGDTALQSTQNDLMAIASSYFDSFDDKKKQALYHHLNATNHLLSTGGTLE
ncbi:MAG: MarR family transcriptional regulator [Anaerotignum sp.]|nr:MarR family transcriptional regulator [Anaerotignum sp.]